MNIILDDWWKVMKDNIYFFWKVLEEWWRVWIVLWLISCWKGGLNVLKILLIWKDLLNLNCIFVVYRCDVVVMME